ncbi:TcmI family type II polyketide cyclase [Geodermatophilus sp. FMUSA9-8]|uniref:TcmI family type II polyketide cyclase n=1 Tax=Geodermatophilus sp. FMUSA9-8 TaxID=3120155 RepID=UPI003009D02C
MHQTMIIARMTPADAERVADVFARSDATSMPHEIGVRHRSLFTFHELYVHLIEFDRPPAEAMRVAQELPAFRSVSEELRPYIAAYDPGWRSPQDAMARRFYEWSADRP